MAMNLSLQKRVNYESVLEQRKCMIETEKLHILDGITYEAFLALHKKYAPTISELEFAKYFLDIDWRSYYNLQSGLRKTTNILEREYYIDSDFDDIQARIINEEGLKTNDKIDYNRLLELHKRYGGKFPLKQFAYEVLNVNAHTVEDMNYKKDRQTSILKPHAQTREQIAEIKKAVIKKSGLHMGQQITFEKLQELYKKYRKYDIDERDFALRILGISNDIFNRLKVGKRPLTTVFSTFPINGKALNSLRKKVIVHEGLYIEQPISNDRFKELYDKYGGILSEELFAEEILDISIASLQNGRRRNNNNVILTGIELSKKYIEWLQNKIIKENGIQPNNQLMSLEELKELRKIYAPMLTDRRFATLIMGVRYENYIQLVAGTTHKNYVFAVQPSPEIQQIRQRVIKENHLHYDDTIEYYALHRLHEQYAPTMREHIFARCVLDICQVNLDNIRNDKGKSYTHILLDEILPTEKDIEEIRRRLLAIPSIRKAEKMSYQMFQELYYQYGGVMPEDMFSLQVLEITQKELNTIKQNPEFKTEFLMKGKQDWKEQKARDTASGRKKQKLLEERVKRIMQECYDSPEDILSVKQYIEECGILFQKGELRPDQLKTFADAIIYVEAERKHIEVFVKACTSFEEYDFCSRNISRNLENNTSLDDDDKIKLKSCQDSVRYALKKQRVVNFIARGVSDVNRIMYMTGALETDIMEIMNRMRSGKTHTENVLPEENGTR